MVDCDDELKLQKFYGDLPGWKMLEWNPEQYKKFIKERTQPAVDLADRIELKNPLSVIDIGCGIAGGSITNCN